MTTIPQQLTAEQETKLAALSDEKFKDAGPSKFVASEIWKDGYRARQPEFDAILAELTTLKAEKLNWQDGRKQGRQEALAILVDSNADSFIHDMFETLPIGDTGDYAPQWQVQKLEQLLDTKQTDSWIDHLQGKYWEHVGQIDGLTQEQKVSFQKGREDALARLLEVDPEDFSDGSDDYITSVPCGHPEDGEWKAVWQREALAKLLGCALDKNEATERETREAAEELVRRGVFKTVDAAMEGMQDHWLTLTEGTAMLSGIGPDIVIPLD